MPHTPSYPRIAFTRHGEHGPPVLLIMGLAMAGQVWGPQVEDLKHHFRCCIYDHLGIGESDPPAQRPSMSSMAQDALRLLDHLGWDQAHVVGVSMGGMVAQELALQHRDRCRSLTLIATHGGALGAGLPTLQGVRYLLATLSNKGPARARALARLLYPPHFLAELGDQGQRAGTQSRLAVTPDLKTVLMQMLAAIQHRADDRLSQLSLPVLLVRPGMDILIRPQQTDRMARRIPYAKVLRFDDAGHGVLFQKRALLNAALRDHFLAAESHGVSAT